MALKNMNNAKEAKKDEWYTQLEDIENEMRHYRMHFRGKTVLCNCDDPYESNFFKYFAMNFNILGLKKLICTSYAGSTITYTQLSLFDSIKLSKNAEKSPYVIEITNVEDYNGAGAIDLDDVEILLKSKEGGPKKLKGDGDFRSEECQRYLKEADIVVTDPPFSLFREYMNEIFTHEKKFILMCRMSCLHYKEIFPAFKENKIWIGYGFNLSVVYKTPYSNDVEANKTFVKSKGYNPEEGYIKVPGICWITNLDIAKRHEEIILYREYSQKDYPSYLNFNGIDVNKISEIPYNYYGYIGVPDTFLEKYNPEQFEICGLSTGDAAKEIGVRKNYRGRTDLSFMNNGKPSCPFSRIIIRRRKKHED
jgi:hypothetical protein